MSCSSSADTSPRDAARACPNTFVIGLGNPILGDDGVGWRIAEAVKARCRDPGVKVACLAIGGLSLMEHLVGSERAIIVDGVLTHQGKIGDVLCFRLDELTDLSAGHTRSAHDVSLQTALDLGRIMGAPLPEDVMVVAVEIDPVFEFYDGLSLEVADAVPVATETVLNLLGRYQGEEE